MIGRYTTEDQFLYTQYIQFNQDQKNHWENELIKQNAARHMVDLRDPYIDLCGPSVLSGGLRSPKLNDHVGGAPSSAHLAGLATDEIPSDLTVGEAFRRIINSGLPYDQAILEEKMNKKLLLPFFVIHLGSPRPGRVPRKEVLTQFLGDKGFQAFNPYDSRLPR